ncbi:MAG: hypothetical protein HN742_03605 [Lentisphaerae bacterium]|jgi:hypothetical protein|nr:hypothetical protein [Lentisphaerota bacterium]MBT4816700.1 hypothetical protein [Lentisphaerota bacterium]MBT5605339.1 hypothetical protein [Lentisphaerota bacterium]MBT7055871.1 hypothetical protein [Lentisphaerota bacterium]MBT7840927.1 hypothetical protein [Lentisphaerota bacterium]
MAYRKSILAPLALVLLSVQVSAQDPPAPRTTVSLNGNWDRAITASPLCPETNEAEWETVSVPHLDRGDARGKSRFAWYRRNIDIPTEWTNQRVFLNLVGARYHPRVYIDGQLIGERLEGWTPFELEISTHVVPGQTHRLDIGCQDWGAVFADGYTLPQDAEGDLRRNDILRGKLIAPIGGHYANFGIWDDAELLARPQTYLDDIAVDTSIRNGTLTVSGMLRGNLANATVRATVRDTGTAVLTPPLVTVQDTGYWKLETAFGKCHLWSPEMPHLYELELLLADGSGKTVDRAALRFGFRELWAEGPDFVFNGVKRHLLATSGWPTPNNQTEEEVRRSLQAMKAGNCVAFRLHTQPWQRKWLKVADEVGIMIIEEGALWCDGTGTYAYKDDRFWQNVQDHLAGMARRDRNHASLVMWSIENEILHCGAPKYDPEAERKLADLGEFLKALDPTHLITFESDHDPGGVADVIGLHYPHEMPANTDYPNTADWLDEEVRTGTGGELLGSRDKAFRWERKKPLYIGEYLWIPYTDYSPGTVFFGEEAYLNRARYNREAKAKSWFHQTLAYRRAGVSGLCPWTFVGSGGHVRTDDILYTTQKAVYEPVAAFPRDLDTRFFTGAAVQRRFDVFNDSTVPLDLELRLELEGRKAILSSPFRLPPAGYREVALALRLPEGPTEQVIPARVILRANGNILHESALTYRVFPENDIQLPDNTRILLYNGEGKDTTNLPLPGAILVDSAEVATAKTATTVLILAPGVLQTEELQQGTPVVGPATNSMAPILAYLARGGRVLCLEQRTLKPLDIDVSLADHPSTMAFPIGKPSSLLAGIPPEAFQFWAGDHYVSRSDILRPTRNGARAHLISGGERNLDQSPLLELRIGRGTLLLCQALVGTKVDTEPSARKLLGNALHYLAERKPAPQQPALLITESPNFEDALRDLGVAYRRPGPGSRGVGSPATSALIIHGPVTTKRHLAAIRAFVADHRGNVPRTVYWHAPTPTSFTALSEELGVGNLKLVPGRGPLGRMAPVHALFAGVTLEELIYVGETTGRSWMRGFTPDPTMLEHLLVPNTDSDVEQVRLEAEAMELDIKIGGPSEDGKTVTFATAGTATVKTTIARAGLHRLVLVAGGSSMMGVYPCVQVTTDSGETCQIALAEGTVKAHPTIMRFPAGEVELTIAFVNDGSGGGEDRNLVLDAVLIDREPFGDSGVSFLTLPPAVAVKERPGKGNTGLRVVVDTIRWDANVANLTRGLRYASALFANLGIPFAPPLAGTSWIAPKYITPVGTIPYFKKTEAEISLVAAGAVEATFDATAERDYDVLVRGRSAPAAGEFAAVTVEIDGREIGQTIVGSRSPGTFRVEQCHLTRGSHHLKIIYTNDLWVPPEDRNLYLHAVGFRPIE